MSYRDRSVAIVIRDKHVISIGGNARNHPVVEGNQNTCTAISSSLEQCGNSSIGYRSGSLRDGNIVDQYLAIIKVSHPNNAFAGYGVGVSFGIEDYHAVISHWIANPTLVFING